MSSFHPGQMLRHLPGMIPGRTLASVRSFMLLIHHDQAQPFKRCKKSRTGSDHNLGLPPPGPVKLVITLPVRQPGMHHTDPFPKPGIKPHHGLKGQGNLRNQHNHLTARRQYMVNHGHVHLCLAASGNSVNQIRRPFPLVIIPAKGVDHLLLLFI